MASKRQLNRIKLYVLNLESTWREIGQLNDDDEHMPLLQETAERQRKFIFNALDKLEDGAKHDSAVDA